MKYINTVSGEKIAYYEYGNGNAENTLLLIHSNLSSSTHFENVYKGLPENIRVIAPDLRGFGNSSYNNKVNSIEDYANDIMSLIEKLEINDFSILGFFLGSAVAMEISARLTNKVKNLILVSPVSPKGFPMYKLTNNEPTEEDLYKTREEVENDQFRTITIQNAIDNKDCDFLESILENTVYTFKKPSPEKMKKYIKYALNQKSISDVFYSLLTFNITKDFNGIVQGNNKIEKITARTLIVYGAKDFIVTAKTIEELERFLNCSVVTEIGSFAHSPFNDCPIWFNKKLFDFIY